MKADNENIKKLTLSAEKGNAIAQHNLSILFSIGALVLPITISLFIVRCLIINLF
jgi:hypothetical protein